jgi:hypothetical protein
VYKLQSTYRQVACRKSVTTTKELGYDVLCLDDVLRTMYQTDTASVASSKYIFHNDYLNFDEDFHKNYHIIIMMKLAMHM